MARSPENTSHHALEYKARAAVESIGGKVLSDEDWQRARPRLLEFGRLLRSWELQRRSNAANEEIPFERLKAA